MQSVDELKQSLREYKEQLSAVETHLGLTQSDGGGGGGSGGSGGAGNDDELGEEERNELTKVTERERERERVLVIRFVVAKKILIVSFFLSFFLSFSWKRFPTGQSGSLRGD